MTENIVSLSQLRHSLEMLDKAIDIIDEVDETLGEILGFDSYKIVEYRNKLYDVLHKKELETFYN